jgi:hypothetical protein
MIGQYRRKFRIEEIRELLRPGNSLVPIVGGAPELGAEAQIVEEPKVVLAPASALQEGSLWMLAEQTRRQPFQMTLTVHRPEQSYIFELETFILETKSEPLSWGSSSGPGHLAAGLQWTKWTATGMMLSGVQRAVKP